MIHTSYSQLSVFYVLTQDLTPHPNGFAVRMPLTFHSGVMRPRTNPVDGQVYVVGQKGWDSKARYDGCFYRIRHAGGPTHLITGAAANSSGLRLTFSCELDPKSITRANFEVLREEGKGTKPVRMDGVRMIDRKTVEVLLPDIEKEVVAQRTRTDKKTGAIAVDVLHPIRVTAKIKAADGVDIEQTVYATVNTLPAE
jgi:hypothetical protein